MRRHGSIGQGPSQVWADTGSQNGPADGDAGAIRNLTGPFPAREKLQISDEKVAKKPEKHAKIVLKTYEKPARSP
jgi:hypothetical protein